ncbi:MAG: hypothetical protein WBD99_03615 [Thermodesulfobacteriota bacterium]
MKINPRSALFFERFPNLMAGLTGRDNEIFLLEPMLSAEPE